MVVTHRCGDEDWLILSAADGAGSAQFSDIGARAACWTFCKQIDGILSAGTNIDITSHSCVGSWLADLTTELDTLSEAMATHRSQFASTFMGAVIGPDKSFFIQIGDGSIVIGDDTSTELVHWSEKGEYANETVFTTSGTPPFVRTVDRRIDFVAILTDGLELLAINMLRRQPHHPFFRPFIDAMLGAQDGQNIELSNSLGRWLQSKAVVDRTDDDKTLVLASRLARPTLLT